MGISKTALEAIWNHIAHACDGIRLETPAKKSAFTVSEVRADELVIILSSDNTMKIGKAAFEDAPLPSRERTSRRSALPDPVQFGP